MSTTNDKYQPRMCRLCLSTTATSFSLIDGGEAPKMLEAVTSLKISPTDDISTVSCLRCVLNLKLAFILQQNILGAERRFRKRITQHIKQERLQNSSDFEEMQDSGEELTSQEVTMTIKDDIDVEEEKVVQPFVSEGKRALYQCDIGDTVLSSQDFLRIHKISFHNIAAANCTKEVQQTRCSLRIAKMTEKLFVCEFCGVKAKVEAVIEQHKNMFHRSKLGTKCNKLVQVAPVKQYVNRHSHKEITFMDDSRPSEEKEKTFTDDSRQDEEREKTFTDDSRQDEEKEKTSTDDTKQNEEKEKTFTDDSRQNEEKEKTFTDDRKRNEETEKTSTDDSRQNEERENALTHDSRRSEEKDKTSTDDAKQNEEKETTLTDDSRQNKEKPKPKYTFNCFTCGEANPSREHINTHFPKRCTICGEVNPSKEHRKEHFPKKCTVCGELNPTREHKKQHSARKSSVCGEPNPSKEHIDEHDSKECKFCDEVDPSKKHTNQHLPTNKCRVCAEDIARDHLQAHREEHRNALGVCELCGKQVARYKMKTHMTYYHKEPKHKCQHCNMIFRGKTKLTIHLKKEHLKQPDFVCQTCGKTFYGMQYLKKHVQTRHEKLRPHICKYCKVGFSTRYAMLTHERKHTNETPYKCQVCGDGFRYNVTLKAHLKSKHDVEDELTYECDVCHKKFASKAALHSHGRIH